MKRRSFIKKSAGTILGFGAGYASIRSASGIVQGGWNQLPGPFTSCGNGFVRPEDYQCTSLISGPVLSYGECPGVCDWSEEGWTNLTAVLNCVIDSTSSAPPTIYGCSVFVPAESDPSQGYV